MAGEHTPTLLSWRDRAQLRRPKTTNQSGASFSPTRSEPVANKSLATISGSVLCVTSSHSPMASRVATNRHGSSPLRSCNHYACISVYKLCSFSKTSSQCRPFYSLGIQNLALRTVHDLFLATTLHLDLDILQVWVLFSSRRDDLMRCPRIHLFHGICPHPTTSSPSVSTDTSKPPTSINLVELCLLVFIWLVRR